MESPDDADIPLGRNRSCRRIAANDSPETSGWSIDAPVCSAWTACVISTRWRSGASSSRKTRPKRKPPSSASSENGRPRRAPVDVGGEVDTHGTIRRLGGDVVMGLPAEGVAAAEGRRGAPRFSGCGSRAAHGCDGDATSSGTTGPRSRRGSASARRAKLATSG